MIWKACPRRIFFFFLAKEGSKFLYLWSCCMATMFIGKLLVSECKWPLLAMLWYSVRSGVCCALRFQLATGFTPRNQRFCRVWSPIPNSDIHTTLPGPKPYRCQWVLTASSSTAVVNRLLQKDLIILIIDEVPQQTLNYKKCRSASSASYEATQLVTRKKVLFTT